MRLFVSSETTKVIFKDNQVEKNIYNRKRLIKMQNLTFKFKNQILHFKIDLKILCKLYFYSSKHPITNCEPSTNPFL